EEIPVTYDRYFLQVGSASRDLAVGCHGGWRASRRGRLVPESAHGRRRGRSRAGGGAAGVQADARRFYGELLGRSELPKPHEGGGRWSQNGRVSRRRW